MSPRDAARSLTDRVRFVAAQRQVDTARLRRQLVFQRILARLATDDVWVLKGGYCLEVRLGTIARATRDLDLAFRGDESLADAIDVREVLADALAFRLDDDFTFRVDQPRSIAADELGRPGWRVTIVASVGGMVFETVKLDVVARADEVEGGTEALEVPAALPAAEFGSVVIEAVDVAQHAAEKAHAYARIYAYDRPSSRVKDLIDLVLLIEAGLLAAAAWSSRLVHVFEVRDGDEPPGELPRPPESWRAPYRAMAEDLGIEASDVDTGWRAVNAMYLQAMATAAPAARETE